MKLLNFELDGDGISLNWHGHNLDLHSCYDFKDLCYEPAAQVVELAWSKSPEPWAAGAALPCLRLVFTGVSFVQVKGRDTAYPPTEDTCLQSLSFSPPDARAEFDAIWLTHTESDDLTFFFQSEWGIKLNAATAELLPG